MAVATNPPSSNGQSDSSLGSRLAQVEQMRVSGRLDEAERLCRAAAEAYSNDPNPLNILALLVRDRGDLGEAETLMRRAMRAAPREAALPNNLGNLLRRKGDLAAAETAYRAAIALRPGYPEAYYNLGITLQELGRSDEALAAQRRASALRPDYADALTQIGVLLHRQGKFTEALDSLNAAVSANGQHFAALYNRAAALMALERHDQAIETLRLVLSLRPDSPEAQHALGNAFVGANREEEALAAYGKVIDLAPEFLDGHYDYNSLAFSMDRKEIALTSFARARARVGEKPDLLLAEADIRLLHKDAPSAEQLLKRAAQIAPERMDVANALARSLAMQGRFAEGIELFRHAAKNEPGAVHHRRDLGMTLLQDRQPDEAKRVLEEALLLAPFDQLVLAFLSLAYRETGDSRLGALVDVDRYVRVYDIPPPPGFADIASFNQALAEELSLLHTRRIEPIDQTLRGGTQTVGNLFAQKTRAIGLVRERIGEAVSDYVANLPYDPAHPLLARKQDTFTFYGSWSCRLRSSGFHTNHVHPEGWISSAYYVSLPDAVDDDAGKQGWLKFGESNLELGANDRPVRAEKPAMGKLVLFPSYYWHGTIPFTSSDMRLSLAFDVTPGLTLLAPPSRRNY